tara:strand:- start:3553 stop:3717 length:165 start_codon:yes stop_codon:yes gene_type:complete
MISIIKMLDRLQESIFRDLDKAGNYRRVDEEEARGIVERNISATKDKVREQDDE